MPCGSNGKRELGTAESSRGDRNDPNRGRDQEHSRGGVAAGAGISGEGEALLLEFGEETKLAMFGEGSMDRPWTRTPPLVSKEINTEKGDREVKALSPVPVPTPSDMPWKEARRGAGARGVPGRAIVGAATASAEDASRWASPSSRAGANQSGKSKQGFPLAPTPDGKVSSRGSEGSAGGVAAGGMRERRGTRSPGGPNAGPMAGAGAGAGVRVVAEADIACTGVGPEQACSSPKPGAPMPSPEPESSSCPVKSTAPERSFAFASRGLGSGRGVSATVRKGFSGRVKSDSLATTDAATASPSLQAILALLQTPEKRKLPSSGSLKVSSLEGTPVALPGATTPAVGGSLDSSPLSWTKFPPASLWDCTGDGVQVCATSEGSGTGAGDVSFGEGPVTRWLGLGLSAGDASQDNFGISATGSLLTPLPSPLPSPLPYPVAPPSPSAGQCRAQEKVRKAESSDAEGETTPTSPPVVPAVSTAGHSSNRNKGIGAGDGPGVGEGSRRESSNRENSSGSQPSPTVMGGRSMTKGVTPPPPVATVCVGWNPLPVAQGHILKGPGASMLRPTQCPPSGNERPAKRNKSVRRIAPTLVSSLHSTAHEGSTGAGEGRERGVVGSG
ncbi:unnamed protein product [Discosporangium mesarthrocarpum]